MTPTLFFFGTLTDTDVLRVVLGRRVDPTECVPASLTGFRRVAVAGAAYPALTPRSRATVPGLLFRPHGSRERTRIAYFEDGYHLRRCRVTLADGRTVACAYWRVGLDIRLSWHDWSPAAWERRDKPAFMRATRMFMHGFAHRDRR